MKHIKKAECELMVGVTFHGGDEELIEDVTFHGGDEELIEDVTFHDKGKDPRVVSTEATKQNVSPMNGTPRPAHTKSCR